MKLGTGKTLDPPDSLEQEMVRLISNQARRVPLPVLIALIIMAWIAFKPLPGWLVGLWFVFATTVMVSRYLTLRSLADRHELTAPQRLKKFVKLNLISGLTHAIALAAFPFFTEAERAFFSVLLMGLCTGSVATCAGYRPALLAYTSPIMVGLSLMWALSPGLVQIDLVERVIGILLLFYLAVLLGLARELNRGIVDAWDIRMREKKLNGELQKALESAENASRAKTRFLAAASHDLRQPLHTITMLGAALSLRPVDARSKEIVDLLSDVTQSFSEQLDGLLDISKLDAGVVAVDRRVVKMSELLNHHAAEVKGLAAAKGLKLNLICNTDAYVNTDAALFIRILRNLTQNAIKFTDQGSITLQAQEVEGHVQLTVADTGHGIAFEQQEKVFQEFYQVGNPERDREQGLGLGLSIVRRLVDLLQISIRMLSAPKEGTIFILELPTADAATVVKPLLVVNEPLAAFDLCVLVIDDAKNVRVSLRMLLEELGCTCLDANGTDMAVEQVALVRPDLVLADFRLRGVDSGLLAIAAVRQRWPGVPALLVSGDTAPDRLQEAQHAGIALLHKPLSLAVLKQQLAKIRPQA